MSKLLTVFGATGNQGGSVVKAILAHPELSKIYKIRATTRDVNKPAAQALKEQGAEVVAVDLNDPASVKQAIQGSSIVFGVTNFWESISADVEIAQGKALVDGSKAAGVDRLIWSSLPNVSQETKGANTHVKHFDSKAEVEAYARAQGVPSTFYMPAVFASGVLDQFRLNGDVYALNWPVGLGSKVPIIDVVADTGKYVAAILLDLPGTLNKRIAAAGENIPPSKIVEGFKAATGKEAIYNQIPADVFKGFLPPPIADELTANMKLIDSPGYYVGEPDDAVEQGHELIAKVGVAKPVTWSEYVKANFKPNA